MKKMKKPKKAENGVYTNGTSQKIEVYLQTDAFSNNTHEWEHVSTDHQNSCLEPSYHKDKKSKHYGNIDIVKSEVVEEKTEDKSLQVVIIDSEQVEAQQD